MPRPGGFWKRNLPLLFGVAAGVVVVMLLTGAAAQAPQQPLRIGVVLPTKGRTQATTAFGMAALGEAVRMGARFAEEELADAAEAAGYRLEVLTASAPDAAAVGRAATRLVSADGVAVLVGGIDDGQREALAEVAAAHGLPFLSLSGGGSLECGTTTFSVVPSDADYAAALVAWFSAAGSSRWHVVQTDTPLWSARYEALAAALAQQGTGAGGPEPAVSVSRTLLPPDQPLFGQAIAAAQGADLVLMLLDASAQLDFLSQYEAGGSAATVTGYPEQATQTRSYYVALLEVAPRSGGGPRLTAWDAALTTGAAGELNERFLSRWGKPMDPAAWAAYAAVRIAVEAVASSGSAYGPELLAAMRDSRGFDVAKGGGTVFRGGSQALLQPLYVVALDPEAPRGLRPSETAALAQVIGTVPPSEVSTPCEGTD